MFLLLFLRQICQRSAYFLVGRAFAVIFINLCPGDFPVFIQNIDRRMRDAREFLPVKLRVADTESVYGFVLRVGEQREIDFALAVLRDAGRHFFGLGGRVNADGVKQRVVVFGQ